MVTGPVGIGHACSEKVGPSTIEGRSRVGSKSLGHVTSKPCFYGFVFSPPVFFSHKTVYPCESISGATVPFERVGLEPHRYTVLELRKLIEQEARGRMSCSAGWCSQLGSQTSVGEHSAEQT